MQQMFYSSTHINWDRCDKVAAFEPLHVREGTAIFATKAAANSAEEEEQYILDTYELAPAHESDSDQDDTPDVPVISGKVSLESLEALPLPSSKSSC